MIQTAQYVTNATRAPWPSRDLSRSPNKSITRLIQLHSCVVGRKKPLRVHSPLNILRPTCHLLVLPVDRLKRGGGSSSFNITIVDGRLRCVSSASYLGAPAPQSRSGAEDEPAGFDCNTSAMQTNCRRPSCNRPARTGLALH